MKCSLIFYVIGIFSHSGKMTSLIKPGPAPGLERWLSDHLRDIQLGHGTFFVAPLIASDFPSIIIIQFSAGVLPAAEHRSRRKHCRLLATSLLIRPVLTSAYHIQPSGELFRPTAGFRLPTTIRQTAQPSTEGSYSPLPAIGREQLLSAPGSRLPARCSRLAAPGSLLPARCPGIPGPGIPGSRIPSSRALPASVYRQPSSGRLNVGSGLPTTGNRPRPGHCQLPTIVTIPTNAKAASRPGLLTAVHVRKQTPSTIYIVGNGNLCGNNSLIETTFSQNVHEKTVINVVERNEEQISL